MSYAVSEILAECIFVSVLVKASFLTVQGGYVCESTEAHGLCRK